MSMLGEKLPRPDFGMALILVLLVVGIQMALSASLTVAGVVVQHATHRAALHLERQPAFIGCVNLIAFSAAITLGLRLNQMSFRRAFANWRTSLPQIMAVFFSLLGAGVLLSEADNVFRLVLPPPRFIIELTKDLFLSDKNVLSRTWLLVMVAPLTEELLFRGIILRGLLSRHRPAMAVMLSAFLFAAMHLNPWQFVSALFLGFLLGWFYVRTGSLTPCIIGHAFMNGLTVLFSLLPWDIAGMTSAPDLTRVQFQPWWLDLAGLLMFSIGVAWFRKCAPLEPPVIAEPAASRQAIESVLK